LSPPASLDRSCLLTEQQLEASMDIDSISIGQAIAIMQEQDRIAVEAVGREQESIARAVEMVVRAFGAGGRLFYIGAGTSGRLGILDASECPPTFRVDPEQVQGIIAGGPQAIFRAVEGAEDSAEDGSAQVDLRQINASDVVMGIAAGGTTPFVRGALQRARALGAGTIFLCCIGPLDDEPAVDVIIRPLVGPEVITGSTRLKAGTATKLVLNRITTIAMIQLGKVYQNLMVDLRATNDKLRDRAIRIVGLVSGLDRDAAAGWLERAGGHVKLAILMRQHNLAPDEARRLLDVHGGHLRRAMRPRAAEQPPRE
jgi:N-acetylmuramic acid 6-phosphate etherase